MQTPRAQDVGAAEQAWGPAGTAAGWMAETWERKEKWGGAGLGRHGECGEGCLRHIHGVMI